MPDNAIVIETGLSASESAVVYALKRMRLEPDYRYHMLHTETFARLCEAEALRIGTTEQAIEDLYSQLAPHRSGEKPRLPACRDALSRIASYAAEAQCSGDFDGTAEKVFRQIREIAEMAQ